MYMFPKYSWTHVHIRRWVINFFHKYVPNLYHKHCLLIFQTLICQWMIVQNLENLLTFLLKICWYRYLSNHASFPLQRLACIMNWSSLSKTDRIYFPNFLFSKTLVQFLNIRNKMDSISSQKGFHLSDDLLLQWPGL